MADTTGFLKFERQLPPRRPVDVRILDWRDVYLTRETGEDEVFPVLPGDVDVLPVPDADLDGTARWQRPVVLQESGAVSHELPPSARPA